MFTCCLPRSRGCRWKKARLEDAVPRWGFHVRTPHRLWPFGRKDRKKATEDTERQLADVPSSLTEGVTPKASQETGAGDCEARPPTPRGPPSQVVVHWTVVQEPEPMEAEAEGEKGGAGCLWCVGTGRCGPTREELPEAGVGPRATTGHRAHSGWTAVGETSP
ncbi:CMT1A duplicated region transcript 15 protein-like protein isoform X2 [Zalophus californianus]|uniref:CMT1A duplicated region transcript 15 protein-like protein isoform X2 n=1 Tax=Zalophus californianus TaxID=9704 RepID=A0A6P9F230_ZALCA|nr:CMT1A duplicated region transcript 15 protein-like protein isoform X2 [Zalophus californianus]